MSFTEWVLGSIIPLHLEDQSSENNNNGRIRNNQDFQYLVRNVRSVIQFNHVITYFLKHQQDEECADIFFHSKVLQKTLESGLKILEQNQEQFDIVKDRNDIDAALDERIVEMCKTLMQLISGCHNQEHANQIFSNNHLSSLICGLFQHECSRICLSESQEFHLLVKSLVLRLDYVNVALFIDGAPRRFQLFDIMCQLEPSRDYHLNISQRNVILIMIRLLADLTALTVDSAFESLSLFLKRALFKDLQHFDLLIDDCLYVNDVLHISLTKFPRVVEVYYELLPEKSLDLIAIAVDIVCHYRESFILKYLKTEVKNVYDLFMLISIMRTLIKHGDDKLLRSLHLLPSTKLYKKTLMNELLETESYQPRSPSTPIAISSKRNSANIEGMRRQESLSNLGPLDPSFNSLSLNEQMKPVDTLPEMLSRSATPTRKHRKQKSEGYSDIKVYETERVGQVVALLTSIPMNDDTMLVQYSCFMLLNDLLDNHPNVNIIQLLNEDHRKYFRNVNTVDHETGRLLLKGLDEQFPLIGDYNQLSFNSFLLKNSVKLQVLKKTPLEESSHEHIHSILVEIFT